ncbi:MAG TPA: hypothetical protein VK211_20085 [Kamptonema sp.]|nr:hypothetical protein [Kamptonema sp.]
MVNRVKYKLDELAFSADYTELAWSDRRTYQTFALLYVPIAKSSENDETSISTHGNQ